ncbi:MAG: branched-chain amino acid ABC transporter permease [Candidatus Rokubacteria bacterium]|nr:branched-chain amino acid ABC transporter permease [Candidatus Rokubacteria bacterium]MBI3106148.1 branched-chain amino acid ABC transporter permease [Candidatus Rokubacteria bacterium]
MARRPVVRDVAILGAASGVSAVVGIVTDPYVGGVLTTALMFIGLTAAWHLVGGYLGQLSLGHAALFGAGAYVTTHLGSTTTLPLPVLFAAGAGGAALTALAMAPAFRARGIYFAIATLGVTGLSQVAAVLLAPGGNLGIVMPFTFAPFSRAPFFWALGLALVSVLTVRLIMASRHGRAIAAIRDDEDAAASLGIDALRYKVTILLLSAVLTGLIGGFYAVRTAFVDPDTVFDVMINVRLLLMAIVGGMGTFWGPILGALTVSIADEALRVYVGPEAAMILYALLLLLLTLWAPAGVGAVVRSPHGRRRRSGERVATMPTSNEV